MSGKPASATHLAGGAGRARWWFGGLALIKLAAEETGGSLSLIEMLYPPHLEVPLHVHHRLDELFYVLDGQMTLRVDQREEVAETGAVVFVPRDTPHGFTVTSADPARYLVLHSPAGFEGFVLATSEPAPTRTLPPPTPLPPPDVLAATDELMAREYATEWVR